MTKELKNWNKNISAKLWEIMEEVELREYLASLSFSPTLFTGVWSDAFNDRTLAEDDSARFLNGCWVCR